MFTPPSQATTPEITLASPGGKFSPMAPSLCCVPNNPEQLETRKPCSWRRSETFFFKFAFPRTVFRRASRYRKPGPAPGPSGFVYFSELPLVCPHRAQPLLTHHRPLCFSLVSLLPSWDGRRGWWGEWHRGTSFSSLHLKPAEVGILLTFI